MTPTEEATPIQVDEAARAAALSNMKLGGTLLGLLFVGSGFFVFEYFNTMQQPLTKAQAASVVLANPFDSVSIVGEAAFVLDITTGETLYEKNADAQLPLASITKVPLAVVIAESMDRRTSVRIPYATGWNRNAEQLQEGQVMGLQDLIDFTLIASSNEGAAILSETAEQAIHARYPQSPVGGATLWRMNNLVSELGLRNTYFLNVSGLDESLSQSGSYGSARDVAKIFAYASQNYPDTFSGTAENGRLLETLSGDRAEVTNTNEALSDIPGLIMGKTGFTDLAGGNLAVVFDVGLARPVVAVVLGSTRESRFTDVKKIVAKARESLMQQ
jgi:D-alanyl-D-alanine carboxypeptidase